MIHFRHGSVFIGKFGVTVRPFRRAIGFVDWHTGVIASGAAVRAGRPAIIAEIALRHVERILSDCLNSSAAGLKFEVRLRLYAGWHSGKTRTRYFHGINRVMGAYATKVRMYHEGRVVFRGGDPRNLTLASPQVNCHQKSGKDAADWVPARNRCWFAARVVEVKRPTGSPSTGCPRIHSRASGFHGRFLSASTFGVRRSLLSRITN